jgi:phosphoesterase RecJ-like protein
MAIPKEILDLFHQSERFYILGHMEPDGDSLGSQMALTLALNNWGKKATPVSPGPFVRKEILHYEERFASAIPLNKVQDALLVILDCSTQDRLGDLAHLAEATTSIVIDHHANGQEYGTHRWIDPSYPATTLMVQDLLEALGLGLTPAVAQELFFGFATDTGFYRHLDEGSAPFIRRSAELVQAGASPKGTFRSMNGGKSLAGLQLLSRIITRSKLLKDGKILYTYEEQNDRSDLGLENRDTDLLYQLFQAVEGVELVVLLRQESENKVTGGLRSLTWFPCGDLADRFGGGGHPRAAGFAREGRLPKIEKEILKVLSDWDFPS